MTNEQIITEIAATIYGEEAVTEMIENGDDIPLHTIGGWNELARRKGVKYKYKVRKGEHGIECHLWKKKKKAGESEEEKTEEQEAIVPSNRAFYMCKSFLFRGDQIELTTE